MHPFSHLQEDNSFACAKAQRPALSCPAWNGRSSADTGKRMLEVQIWDFLDMKPAQCEAVQYAVLKAALSLCKSSSSPGFEWEYLHRPYLSEIYGLRVSLRLVLQEQAQSSDQVHLKYIAMHSSGQVHS